MLQVSHVAESRDCFKETIIAVRCGRKRVAAFNGVAGLNSRGDLCAPPQRGPSHLGGLVQAAGI